MDSKAVALTLLKKAGGTAASSRAVAKMARTVRKRGEKGDSPLPAAGEADADDGDDGDGGGGSSAAAPTSGFEILAAKVKRRSLRRLRDSQRGPVAGEADADAAVVAVNVAAEEPALPAGWSCDRVDETGEVFYVHDASGITSWAPPAADGSLAVDERGRELPDGWRMMPAKGDAPCYFLPPGDGATTWESPLGDDDADDGADAADADADVARPLPDPWVSEINAEGREFFVHRITGETAWAIPS
jgi:hypothetical protein